MQIFALKQIQQAIDIAADLEGMVSSQKAAFIDFTAGLYNVPIPMQFLFPEYHSDCHIKGGYKQGSEYLVVKIANSSPSGISGVILVFASKTGELQCILDDNGWLTTLRTAIAGILASELIPWRIQNIGIVGSGHVGKMLYDLASMKYPNTNVMLYARNSDKARKITENVCKSVDELVTKCDLIFTATSSENPLINDIDYQSNKAIIALGSDDEHKRELSLELFGKSDVIIIDSKRQALRFGDVAKSVASGIVSEDSLIELGNALKSGIPHNAKTIIMDFSGLGAQDVAMIEFILPRLLAVGGNVSF